MSADMQEAIPFGQMWFDLIINDTWLYFMEQVVESPKALLDSIDAFMQQHAKNFPKELPAFLSEPMSHAVKAMRGFACMVCPVPGMYGSSDSDVVFLRDMGGAEDIGIKSSCLTVKLTLARRLRRVPWNTMYDQYDSTKGPAQVSAAKGKSMCGLISRRSPE